MKEDMSDYVITIHTESNGLPPGRSFFQSGDYFRLCEATPRMKPYMAVVTDREGREWARLMAVVCYRTSWLPPFFLAHCRMLGEGEYEESLDMEEREMLFGRMLDALMAKMPRVLYYELSHLQQKMFGYKSLRRHGFYPVKWMSISNSLHSKAPEERLTPKMLRRIRQAQAKPVVVREVETQAELHAFIRLFNRHNRFKPRHYIPHQQFFSQCLEHGYGHLFITQVKGKTIGCCACVISEDNVSLWYSAFLRKTYLIYHPDLLTVWHVIQWAYQMGFSHISFMDVGLPFMRNSFRDFILRFGGKPSSTFRWFRFSIPWFNRLLEFLFPHL